MHSVLYAVCVYVQNSIAASVSSAAEPRLLRKRKQPDVQAKAGRNGPQKRVQRLDIGSRSSVYGLRVHPAKYLPFQIGGNAQRKSGT